MFHEQNDFSLLTQTKSTMKVNENYLSEEIETEPSENPVNIDEPATFNLMDDNQPIMRRDTFVGTPLYVSPEML